MWRYRTGRTKQMPLNKNYFLPILVLFAVFFAVMAILIPSPQKGKVGPSSLPTQQPPTISASVSFQPERLSLTPGQEFTLNVFLKIDQEVVSADLEIIYDPTVLTFQKITLGKFWRESELISSKIDTKNGKILVGIGSFESASGSGNLISLTLKVQKVVKKSVTELKFGEKTQIFNLEGEPILLEVKKEAIYNLIE